MNNDEKNFNEEPVNDQQRKGLIRKASIGIMLVALLIFAGIVLFTEILGTYFGKSVEVVALVIVAMVLVVLLYKSKRS